MLRTPPIRTGTEERFEQQLDASYRRNFKVLCFAYMGLACLGVMYVALATPRDIWMEANWRVWLRMLLLASGVLLAGAFLFWNRRRQMTRSQLTNVITSMIVLIG